MRDFKLCLCDSDVWNLSENQKRIKTMFITVKLNDKEYYLHKNFFIKKEEGFFLDKHYQKTFENILK